MNKTSKHKTSCKTIKSSRNLTTKEINSLTSRTPRNRNNQYLSNQKSKVIKFKSIPTITYKDIETYVETSQGPYDNPIFQSYTGNCIEQAKGAYEVQPRLLYSVSDRNNSVSKLEIQSKLQKSVKRTNISSKNKSNYTAKTHRNSTDLELVLERTRNILKAYKLREENWKREKQILLKELQKYRPKLKKGKNMLNNEGIKNIRLS